MTKAWLRILIVASLVLGGLASVALSADYPQRPIRMIVPWSAGGGNDVLCRAFQPAFEKVLGQKILIENIPAGTTKVGTLELMKSKPDGYTLIFSTTESWLAYYYSKTYESKVWEQMVPIGNITSEPYGFVEALVESPFKTWTDLVRTGKENPGKLSCGGPGAGGMMELIMNEITRASGIQTRYVPFAGAGASKIALLGGHIDFRVCQPPEAISMIRAGKTRGLAVSTDKRMEAIPDVPTFKELGIGGTIDLTRSIWGPPKTPVKVVETLTKAIEKATKDPEFIKVAQEQLLYTVDYRPAEKMKAELKNFDQKFGAKLAEMYK
ncbi:MAG TPA: tripartite tricarboxylate transporter substrate binding protein [Thermodesulfobacteriota bacterium]|nr:tripartite tricarboxylate transporter substrate binding protein [Thermodesulfobacteriota bacterium]